MGGWGSPLAPRVWSLRALGSPGASLKGFPLEALGERQAHPGWGPCELLVVLGVGGRALKEIWFEASSPCTDVAFGHINDLPWPWFTHVERETETEKSKFISQACCVNRQGYHHAWSLLRSCLTLL